MNYLFLLFYLKINIYIKIENLLNFKNKSLIKLISMFNVKNLLIICLNILDILFKERIIKIQNINVTACLVKTVIKFGTSLQKSANNGTKHNKPP